MYSPAVLAFVAAARAPWPVLAAMGQLAAELLAEAHLRFISSQAGLRSDADNVRRTLARIATAAAAEQRAQARARRQLGCPRPPGRRTRTLMAGALQDGCGRCGPQGDARPLAIALAQLVWNCRPLVSWLLAQLHRLGPLEGRLPPAAATAAPQLPS